VLEHQNAWVLGCIGAKLQGKATSYQFLAIVKTQKSPRKAGNKKPAEAGCEISYV